METVLIIVKLNNNIFIQPNDATKVYLGKGYFKAQDIYHYSNKNDEEHLSSISTEINKEGFKNFTENFQSLFPKTKLYALYCLADKVSYIKNSTPKENILNYFAFRYQPSKGQGQSNFLAIDDKKNEIYATDIPASPTKIEQLVNSPEIDHWWYEGEMTLTAPTSGGCDGVVNAYYDILDFKNFPSKGENVLLFDAEDYGSMTIDHPYLSNINKHSKSIENTPTATTKNHFYKTL